MSQLVFPSALPGLKLNVSREQFDGVDVQTTLSKRELRSTYESYPRYRYTLDFEILRSDSAIATRARELQQYLSHIARHFGRLDSFLFTDPDDSSVTDCGFWSADGSTASAQLQRTLAGDVIDAAGFQYKAQTKPYTNLLKNSSFETDSNADGLADSWAVYNNESATVPTVPRIVPGMNGGKAQRISWGTPSVDNAKGVTQAVTWVKQQWFTISLYARGQGSVVGSVIGLRWNALVAPDLSIAIAAPALSGSWQRYVYQVQWTVSNIDTAVFITPNQAGIFGDIDFDLIQIVTGQHGVSDFQPIETPAASSGTDTPSYWPQFADGFEPIFDLNGSPTFYQDGDWQGRRQLYPYARKNELAFSEQLDNAAAWQPQGGATVAANATVAPDGTTTGEQINEGTGVNTVRYVDQGLTVATGELRCYSVFVKANNLPNIIWGRDIGAFIGFNLSTGVIDVPSGGPTAVLASGVITSPLWPGWYRIWCVVRENTAQSSVGQAFLFAAKDGTYAMQYTGTSRTFYAWGAQAERVSNLNGPTPYIKTPSSAAVAVVDYTLSSDGIFTPASVPAAGTFFSWDGSYYRRVRFDTQSFPVDRLFQSMWEAKGVALISVKPKEQSLIIPTPPIPFEETPAGTINGTTGSDGNPTFTLSKTPVAGLPVIGRRNGIALTQGVDFTVAGVTVTALAPNIPITGDSYVFLYWT